VLFLAGVALAVISVASWLTLGNHPSSDSGHPAGTCQVPAHGRSGTEPPPPFVHSLLAPFGTADATFTRTAGGATVYGYCFDVVAGSKVQAAMNLLNGHGYASSAGDDAQRQLNFVADNGHPYGVSLTLTGDLTFPHPAAGALGGVALVWQDTASG
jgi:hypothetical protein